MVGRVNAWLSQEHWLIGASLTRISLGCWGAYHYILLSNQRYAFWGPDGIIPLEGALSAPRLLNLLTLSGADAYFELVYAAALAIAILMTLGVLCRLTVPLHWLMIWTFQSRNELITDGGDNIMRIVLFFLMFVNTGAFLAVDALWKPRRFTRALRPVLAVLHNFGVLFIIVQFCFLYMSTGMYKVMGELWQNGTALYYILRVDEFSWPGVAEFVYRNPYLVVGGTYGTVLFELLFAPALLNRWARLLFVLPAGLFFHVGIGALMGLTMFTWSMLSLYPMLVTDAEYRMSAGWVRGRLGLTVYYDGWCPLCTRSVRWLRFLDLFSLVDYRSFREDGAGIDLRRAELRIQSVNSGLRVREGMDTTIQIAGRSPFLWPLLPLLILLRAVAGHRAYDFLASRRFALLPGRCAEHCAR